MKNMLLTDKSHIKRKRKEKRPPASTPPEEGRVEIAKQKQSNEGKIEGSTTTKAKEATKLEQQKSKQTLSRRCSEVSEAGTSAATNKIDEK